MSRSDSVRFHPLVRARLVQISVSCCKRERVLVPPARFASVETNKPKHALFAVGKFSSLFVSTPSLNTYNQHKMMALPAAGRGATSCFAVDMFPCPAASPRCQGGPTENGTEAAAANPATAESNNSSNSIAGDKDKDVKVREKISTFICLELLCIAHAPPQPAAALSEPCSSTRNTAFEVRSAR